MDVPPSTSNTPAGTPLGRDISDKGSGPQSVPLSDGSCADEVRPALGAWVAALEAHAAALGAHWDFVGPIAQKAATNRWRRVGENLLAAGGEIAALKAGLDAPATSAGATQSARFRDLLAVADRGVLARRHLEEAGAIAADPSFLRLAAVGFSRASVEAAQSRLRLANSRRDESRRAESGFAIAAARCPFDGLGVEEAGEAFFGDGSSPRGELATGLYTGHLARYATGMLQEQNPMAAARARNALERAKDLVLGRRLSAGPPAPVAGLHPAQAVGIVVSPARPSGVAASGSNLVDFSLPQARVTVAYDLAPLIDAAVALRFGPIASADSGLNYNIVQRFRTIREIPKTGPPSRLQSWTVSSTPLPPCVTGPLGVTLDGGASAAALADRAAEKWTPCPRPRVELYGRDCAAVARGVLGDAELRAARLTSALEAAGAKEVYALSSDVILRLLLSSFAEAYDRAFPHKAPASAEALAEALVEVSPSFLDDALMQAADYRGALYAKALQHSAPLVPPNEVLREGGVHALFRAHVEAKKLAKVARRVYRARPPDLSGEAPEKRGQTLDHFARTVAPEVLKAVPFEGGKLSVLKTTAKVHTFLASKDNDN